MNLQSMSTDDWIARQRLLEAQRGARRRSMPLRESPQELLANVARISDSAWPKATRFPSIW